MTYCEVSSKTNHHQLSVLCQNFATTRGSPACLDQSFIHCLVALTHHHMLVALQTKVVARGVG